MNLVLEASKLRVRRLTKGHWLLQCQRRAAETATTDDAAAANELSDVTVDRDINATQATTVLVELLFASCPQGRVARKASREAREL